MKPGRYLFLSLFIWCFACRPASDEVIVRKLSNGQFGYDIRFNDKIFIKQENIPAINFNTGFATDDDAKRVGELVLKKIQQNPNEFPDVSVQELDSLKIQY
ncbi:MAG TPA: DUF4907 domain-containing protein [Flavobacterium sp.]